MITLVVLFYIVCSLCLSFSNMRDRYTIMGGFYKAQKPKEAFTEGFLFLPVLILCAFGFVGVILFVGAVLLGILIASAWIFQYMP